jgi:PDZ domain
MNSSQTKVAAWGAAGAIGLGLFAYVAWFVVSLKRERMVTQEEMRSILENVTDIVQKADDIIAYPKVEASLISFDWSGRPKELAQAAPTEAVKPEPSAVPMAQLVKVMFLSYDSAAPEDGLCILRYTPEAQVRAAPPSQPGAQPGWKKRPGDVLDAPLEHVRVHAIRPDGVEFSFSDTSRANEVVAPGDFDLLHIVKRDSEEEIVEPESNLLLVPRVAFSRNPPETTRIDDSTWQIGVDTADRFAKNYAEELAIQRSADHRDPRTGRRDGIQLLDVAPGSMAESHGLSSGDIVKSINGHPVTSKQEAITFVKNNKDVYDKWEVVVESKGLEKTLVYYSPQK